MTLFLLTFRWRVFFSLSFEHPRFSRDITMVACNWTTLAKLPPRIFSSINPVAVGILRCATRLLVPYYMSLIPLLVYLFTHQKVPNGCPVATSSRFLYKIVDKKKVYVYMSTAL